MTLSAIVIGVVGFLGLVILMAVARRALRLVVKLALLGLLLVAVCIGALVVWWNGGLGSTDRPSETRPASTRRNTGH
jgi:phosphoglycerol transferase MdoB-like AlkP superfamily enzyme